MHVRIMKLALLLTVGVSVAAATTKSSTKRPASYASSSALGGDDRYRTHVSTDKSIYRESETVYVRAVPLHVRSHAPLDDAQRLYGAVKILGPKGETVSSGQANGQQGTLGFAWRVPAGAAGGEYQVQVTVGSHGLSMGLRKFEIRAYRAPRLKTQIVFLRDGFGPGDTVNATLHVKRAEGGIPRGVPVTIMARLDGAVIYTGKSQVNDEGQCATEFTLPSKITRGEGTLAMTIQDGGIVETATKTVPIVLQTLDLTMYAEGGNLVAGLPGRVYVEAKTPSTKPADLEGAVYDDLNVEVARFKTEHEGRGSFTFKPQRGRTYTLKILEPAGINTTYPLPKAAQRGAVLMSLDDVTPANKFPRFRVGSTESGSVHLTVSKLELEVGATTIAFENGRRRSRRNDRNPAPGTTVEREVKLPKNTDGVLVATLWDDKGKPLAERLIFREPAKNIYVSVHADRQEYVIGGKVALTIKTTDARNRPVAATVGVTVTDESVLEMLETRDHHPRLPAMVFLEDEVRELADAHVYLAAPGSLRGAKAARVASTRTLDLLLGTQGWRRFALVDAAAFIRTHKEAAKRLLAVRLPPPKPVMRRPRPSSRHNKSRSRSVRGAIPSAPPPMMALAEAEPSSMAHDEPEDDVPMAAMPQRSARPQKHAAKPASVKKPPAPPRADARQQKQEQAARNEIMAASKIAPEAGLMDRKRSRKKRIYRPQQMLYIREYAHPEKPNRDPNDRTDFTETVYWHAGIRTNDAGVAKLSFAMSDSVTAFRVAADAFGKDGALGMGTKTLASIKPFYVEPKAPLQVTSGDVILLPVATINATPQNLGRGTLAAKTGKGMHVTKGSVRVPYRARARGRHIFELRVGNAVGKTSLTVDAKAGNYSDHVEKTIDVQPLGFPAQVAAGGMLKPNSSITFNVDIPQTIVAGSLEAEFNVTPTPLGSMNKALTGLIREPHGCFEQTSSSNYPLVMAQQYFTTHSGIDAKTMQRSRSLLDKGYKRLVSFECSEKGYEWFGKDPAHEALSAYGLMQFMDMAKVYNVDMAMVNRTRQRIMQARDGQGGFKHERRALHTWLVDPDLHNGYITWALLESGQKNLASETRHFLGAAGRSKNTYVTAVAANVARLARDRRQSSKFRSMLAKAQDKDGALQGATTSIVGSRGVALTVETTSLAVLAWLPDSAYAGNVQRAIKYLAGIAKGGRYGSTQSTVLALRAIIAYDKTLSKKRRGGDIRVLVDGHQIGRTIAFKGDTEGALALPDLKPYLRPGRHRVEIKLRGGNSMPYSFTGRFNQQQPDSSRDTRISLRVRLGDSRVTEGSITEADVTVSNLTAEVLPMPVAIIGIPGGLEARHEQLKELRKAGKIAAYEVRGRDVVLYWRELKAKQVIRLPISVVAEVPGSYTGASSRTYEYYTDEHKHWVPGLKINIAPRP